MMDRSCSAPDPQAVDPQPAGTNLPEPLVDFVARFNAREFWESHEVLEIPWRTGRSEFYHGLILYASAFVHAQRDNRRGVQAQLAKATRRLAPYRPVYLGLNVDAILAEAERYRQRAATGAAVLFPTLRLDSALVRGDEPELEA
jgi:predicted metal-dependent hydrolase